MADVISPGVVGRTRGKCFALLSGRPMKLVMICVFAVSLLSSTVRGADKEQRAAKELPAHLQNPMVNPPDNPDLPNVLLIGDSISIGYTVAVRKLLDGKADVFRPIGNCGPSGRGVACTKAWLGVAKRYCPKFS